MRRLGRTVRECVCHACGTLFIREVRAIKGKLTWCTRACYLAHAPGNRIYTLNEHFFADITTQEQAYILGFAAADGGIGNDEGTLFWGLQPQDRDILEKIRTHLQSDAPIKPSFSNANGQERYESVVFYVSSKTLIQDLIRHGITERKSLTLGFPSLSKPLLQHYVRGLWDGDGHVGRRQFSLSGTFATAHGAQQAIASATGIMLPLAPQRSFFTIEGYAGSVDVLHWLYQGSTIHLQRKFSNYQRYWCKQIQHQLRLL